MNNKKNISINPIFLKIKDTKKKEKKIKPKFNNTLKPNNIKKALIKKIREHQYKKKGGYQKEFKNQLKFEKDFKQSLAYLNDLNKTTPSSPSNIKSDPPYGILKGGKKPLYSDYKKTLKKQQNKNKINVDIKQDNDKFVERRQKLNELKNKICPNNSSTNNRTFKKIIKRRLGKIKNKVYVLIKNIKSRKKIKNICKEIKKKKLSTIKSKLRKKGLLKVGSFAPENIIREIYNASELTGDVYNKNGEVLLHNYMNEQT